MSALTGGFDAAIEISGAAFARVARSMHAAGSVSHQHVRISGGDRYEFSFGAPQVSLDLTTRPDPWVRCIASSRAYCRRQAADDPQAPVSTATAEINLRGRLELPAGDPAPIGPNATAVVDWTETASADVTVTGVPQADQPDFRDALLGMVMEDSTSTFDVSGFAAGGVSQMALVALPAAPPGLGVGLNFTGNSGNRQSIANVLQQDWVVAIDSEFVCEQIVASLLDSLGALPPPYGQAPVLVSTQTAKVFDTPLGPVTTTAYVYLDAITVQVTSSGIQFAGAVRQVATPVGPFPIPPVSAQWQATVTAAVDPQGGFAMNVSHPTVQLNEWYAAAADTLSNDALSHAVSAGIEQAIGATFAGGDPSGMLGVLVGQLAAAGRTAEAQVMPRPTWVEYRPQALLIHGALDANRPPPQPEAAFNVMATPNPGELLFDSFASWAPGDDIASFEWSFGDGTTADLSGNNAAIAIDHSFANGDYTVCLKVTDSQGRSDQSCTFVRPGRLVMEHLIDEAVSNRPWQACVSQTKQVDLNVQVTSCGTRIPGVTVIATGSGGGAQGVTDAMGRVTLQVDPQKATPAPPGANTMFAKGSFAITADLAGFDADHAVVELVDCEAIWHAVIESKKAYARWLDRMAGYAALKELIASGIGRKKLPVLPGTDPIGPPEPDDTWPLRNKILTGDELDALGIALGTRVIGDLVTLMELNRSAFPVHELLGLDPENDGFPKQLDSRLKTMMKGLDAAGRRVDAAGPGAPHEPDRPGRPVRPDF